MSQLEPTCQKGTKIGRYKSRQIPEFKASHVGYGNFRTRSISKHFYNVKKKMYACLRIKGLEGSWDADS